jgi:hypothetical protein
MVRYIFILLALTTIAGCESKDDPIITDSKNIVGNWKYANTNDTLISYFKVETLSDTTYGFTMKPDNFL